MRGDDRPIGVFDSGAGGLTAFRALARALPNESVVYAADTARLPYGAKDTETLFGYAREIIRFLISKDVKAVLIACGTISSTSYERLLPLFDIPLFDIVRPGVAAYLAGHDAGSVGVVATAPTVRSGFFERLLGEKKALNVYARACPLFVPLVEEGWADSAVAARVAEAYLGDWRSLPLDAVILGCTHYPLLENALRAALGETPLLDLAEAAADAMAERLRKEGLLCKGGGGEKTTFYVSGDAKKFNALCKRLTGYDARARKARWAGL
jgi:glutamate racemase